MDKRNIQIETIKKTLRILKESGILLEKGEENILDRKIKNPETGRNIKIATALTYDDKEPVKKAALKLIHKGEKGIKASSEEPIKKGAEKKIPKKGKATPEDDKKNARSHKPKSASYGISKELVLMLKDKGFGDLNVYPQSFVTKEQLQFNPKVEGGKADKDSTWVAKFPSRDKQGKEITKTAYTKAFMAKGQVNKYKKISKISEKDILDLHKKTEIMLKNPDRAVSDSAAVLGIILKTGLRIGSVDESDTGNLGVRTLKAGNIKVNKDKINLNFIGKSYQENVAEFEDKALAAYLKTALEGKKPEDKVFSASYGQVGKVMDKINPKGINPKDLRTYKATATAKSILQDKKYGPPPPLPDNPKEATKMVKDKLKLVFEEVAKVLNNTPSMARNSYVHPVVITDYLKNLKLQPKEVGYAHVTLESIQLKEVDDTDVDKMNTVEGFTTMDQMFADNPQFGEGDDGEGEISEEDLYDCEEYPIPEWFFNENWELVPIEKKKIAEAVQYSPEDLEKMKKLKSDYNSLKQYHPQDDSPIQNYGGYTVQDARSAIRNLISGINNKYGVQSQYKPNIKKDFESSIIEKYPDYKIIRNIVASYQLFLEMKRAKNIPSATRIKKQIEELLTQTEYSSVSQVMKKYSEINAYKKTLK